MGTDNDWEKWGSTDPYFGVLSDDKFRGENLDHSARDEFFASGTKHVESVLTIIRRNFDPEFAPSSTLDFGCGVGRLVIPFGKVSERVVGVDISPSMLVEARLNCKQANAQNVDLIQSNDISKVEGQYDLVHSYIVLQHISWRRGRVILKNLAEKVAPGGYLAVHIATACHAPMLVRSLVKLRYRFPPANWARNLLSRRPVFEPAMQRHVYDLDTVKSDIRDRNFDKVLCVDEPPDKEFSNTFLFALRSPTATL